MKKVLYLFLAILIIPFIGLTQTIENLDFISPFHDDLSAIQKDGQWAFINTNGDVVIDFRDDLVTTKSNDTNYPIFNDGRCLIKQKKDGITYFGYIDTHGLTRIEPQFLNANNFSNGIAIALELTKKTVGVNDALGKNVVYYKYFEVTIDTKGVVQNYLIPKGTNVVLDNGFIKMPPEITSKRISENLYAFKDNNSKMKIINIQNLH